MVVNELRGEKIDIVPFSDDPPDFVMKALSPAKVKEVRIDETSGTAEVIVPDYQLSLAIGKEGQNARLAARLTGWRVDIKSETQLADEEAYGGEEWAQGEWVVDPESGEQVWVPAEGGPALSADQWAHLGGPPADEIEAAVDASDEDATPGGPVDVAEVDLAPPPKRRRCTSRSRSRQLPLRTCIGCRARRPQAELVRMARGPDGTLAVGRTLPGRGAWLCQASLPCFDAAVRRRGFAKALRVKVDAEELGRLRTNFVPSGPAARD